MRYEIVIRGNIHAASDSEAMSIAEKQSSLFENGELVEVNRVPFGSFESIVVYKNGEKNG